MADVVSVVADRLAAQVTSRTVYRHGVPDNPAARYLFVYSAAPIAESTDLADTQSVQGVTVWVASASSGVRERAADEAAWGARAAAEALRGWRPVIGSASWKLVHLAGQPAQRDEDRPDVTVFYAVDTYGALYQA